MISEGAMNRKLAQALGADRARVLVGIIGATDRAISQSAVGDSFLGQEMFPALTALYGAARFAVQQTIDDLGMPEADRLAAQMTLFEMDAVLSATGQPDPNPPAPRPNFMSMLGPDLLAQIAGKFPLDDDDTDPEGGVRG